MRFLFRATLMAWFVVTATGIGVGTGAQPLAQPFVVTIHGHDLVVELVRSGEEWQRGLMFRRHMATNRGMLFWGSVDRPQSFWMKNTLIPLDMIFINAQWEIVSIVHNAEPETTTPRRSEGPARHILEINGGLSQRWALKKGMKVKLNETLQKALRHP